MARRLKLQHRMRLNRVEWGQMRRNVWWVNRHAAKTAVAKDRIHCRRVAGADQIIVLPVKERPRFACGFIERIRVLHKDRVCGGL